MIKNSKKLQLWVLSRGHIPTSRMAHKVYNWVDPQGRPASPPPDPFEVQEQLSSSSKTLMNQPDERKVGCFVISNICNWQCSCLSLGLMNIVSDLLGDNDD